MKVTSRAQMIGTLLYSLPFLGIIWMSLFYMWPGNTEMIVAGAALLPAILFLFGIRWCRYVVAIFSLISLLLISAIPFSARN
jgi:hypothetical protein